MRAMSICICNTSALEALRSSGRLLPELLEGPRYSQPDSTPAPSVTMLRDEMKRVGLAEGPYHLLVPSKNLRYAREDVIFHTRERLPLNTLLRSHGGPLITGPELTFCDLAASGEYDVIDLIEIGYELCGTYLIRDCWDGYIANSIRATTREKIERVIADLAQQRGAARARSAIEHVENGSNSPMETVLAMLLSLPKSLGGQNLGPIRLNHPVATAQGVKYIDVAFPAAKLGLEYKGREAHSLEESSRDDRRQNTLSGAGWSILSVRYEDLIRENLYANLLHEITRLLGVRVRTRSDSFRAREAILRMRLLPALDKRYR